MGGSRASDGSAGTVPIFAPAKMGLSPLSQGPLRRVVLHADDFGMNRAATDGILQGFEHGLLTSTSVLANAPDAERALQEWKRLEADRGRGDLPSSAKRSRLGDPDLAFDLGVHLNLTQGRPLTGDRYPAELLDAQGRMPGIFRLFRRLWRGGRRFALAVEDELSRQIQLLLDHGHRPSHLNGHQYVELIPPVARLVPALLEKFRIPAVRVAVEPTWARSLAWPAVCPTRWLPAAAQQFYARRFRKRMDQIAVSHPDALFGTMTAGCVDLPKLRAFLSAGRRFPLAEIVLHPAQAPAEPPGNDCDGWHDPLADMRPKELQMVMSEGLVEQLAKQQLRLARMFPLPEGEGANKYES